LSGAREVPGGDFNHTKKRQAREEIAVELSDRYVTGRLAFTGL
jgi:hypothetical protein